MLISIECNKSKSKVFTRANQTKWKIPQRRDENSKCDKQKCLKHGKTRLVLDLNPIGRESWRSFLEQSEGKVKQNQSDTGLDTQLEIALIIR